MEVDPAAELSGVYRYVGAGGTVMRPTTVDGPAMVFHNVKGHPGASVAIGVLASRARVASLFGCRKEELGHLEMVGTLVHQLTRNLTEEQIRTSGFDTYFVDHTTGVFPQFASGYPWSASTMQVTGDVIADLTEDLAAEQKARVTYDNILRLSDDPDVNDVIRFLRAREIVHFQRFGGGLRLAKDKMNEKNVYYMNPAFDK